MIFHHQKFTWHVCLPCYTLAYFHHLNQYQHAGNNELTYETLQENTSSTKPSSTTITSVIETTPEENIAYLDTYIVCSGHLAWSLYGYIHSYIAYSSLYTR